MHESAIGFRKDNVGRPANRVDIETEQLTTYLRALAVPGRLELLRKLQVPRTSREVEILPSRRDKHLSEGRPLTRQAIEKHIAVLQEVGLVQARATTRDGRAMSEYVVNHARLFVVVEELRRLSLIRPTRGVSPETIGTPGAPPAGAGPAGAPRGPSLRLVNGPREGQVFVLEGDGPWAIGRATEASIHLAYDPFVSRENARVRRVEGVFVVEALSGARNGTFVNGEEVPEGARMPLVAGDLVEVGRSVLVFRERGGATALGGLPATK